MAHSHDNGSYASASNSHGHTKVQTAKYCKAINPTHTHSGEFLNADAHTHAVVLAFASASLGSPNWWEHTHAVSLVSCGNGGGSHNHASDLLGAQCGNCNTPADHVHAQGTVAVANTDATHSHAFVAGGVTGNADPSGTPAAHVHAFSITLDANTGHQHTVSGTYASTVCDGGFSHNHAAVSPTGQMSHTQGVSGSTPSGGESGSTPVNVGDSGSGSDAFGLSASLGVSDSGAGSESGGLTASLPLAEAGSGVEVMLLGLPLAEAGAGAEFFTLSVTVGVSDSGSGADTEALTAQLPIADSGAGSDSEALTAQVSGSESGSGLDSLGLAASVGLSDSGVGSELFALLASLSMSDSGAGVDSVAWGVLVSAFDSGVGSDAVSLLASLALADVAAGTETFDLLAALGMLESGLGLDTADLTALLDALADSGVGVDVVDVAVGALLQAWGYSLPSKLRRKLGVSGASVRTSNLHLGLKVGLLDEKKVSMGVSGRPFQEVKCWAHVDISRLGRRQRLGVGGRAVVPGVGESVGVKASAVSSVNSSVKARGHLLRHMESSSAKVEGRQGFGLVAEVLGLLEMTYTFMFVAVTDDKTCKLCTQFDGMTFDGADIERMFPYAEQVDYSLWMVKIHPNCRCMLVLLEVGP